MVVLSYTCTCRSCVCGLRNYYSEKIILEKITRMKTYLLYCVYIVLLYGHHNCWENISYEWIVIMTKQSTK